MSNPRSGIYLQNREEKQAVDDDLPNRAAEGDGDVCIDLISGLPEPILHHILCFLTQREAVLTSVLSKSWRNIWPTRPKFDFCERHFGGDQRKFISIIEKLNPWKKCNLKIYCVGDVKLKHLKSLKLIQVFIEDETLEFLLSGCPLIEDLVISQCHRPKNIKLNECLNLKHFGYCNWGRAVDTSIEINIHSIESISINGCLNWFHCHQSDSDDGNNVFPLLQSLHLLNVHLSSQFFHCLSSHIPHLENLTLTECSGFEEYQLSSQTIKHLMIERMDMVGWLDCLSGRFPKLETLNIQYCYGLEEYRISSQSIKHLKIVSPKHDSTNAVIDAPNLVEFEYEGHIPKSISFEKTSVGKTSVEWESKLVLHSVEYTDSSWCPGLYEFLMGFFGSQISLDISIDHIKGNRKRLKDFHPSLVAAQDTRKPIAVEHLTMRSMGHSSSSLSALVNNMFCIFRPRNITQFTYSAPHAVNAFVENQLSECLKKVLLSERAMRHCYPWKQDLEEASMEIGTSLTSFIDDKIHKKPFMFRLKWKE